MSPDRSSMDEQSRELEELLLQPNRPSPVQVWLRLHFEERSHAANSFLKAVPGARARLNGLVARSLNYRVATISRWPRSRLVRMLCSRPMPNGKAARDLLVHGQLAPERPIAASLLDRLGIPHREGLVDATEKLDASEAAVREAAESLSREYGRRAVALCFLVYRLDHAPLGKKARAWLDPAEDEESGEDAGDTGTVEDSPEAESGEATAHAGERGSAARSRRAAPPLPTNDEHPRAGGDSETGADDREGSASVEVPTPRDDGVVSPPRGSPAESSLADVPAETPAAGGRAVPPAARRTDESPGPPHQPPPPPDTEPTAPEPPPELASPVPGPTEVGRPRDVESRTESDASPASPRYEPEEDHAADTWLTTLDHLLVNVTLDVWRRTRGALKPDDLDDAVDEFVTLNAHRSHSRFHAGHRDALFARVLDPGRDLGDPARLRWYWAGVVSGLARREDWREIVRAADTESVVREFGAGEGPASAAAAPALVKAFIKEGRSADLAEIVAEDAVTTSPELFETLLEAATGLLRKRRHSLALRLFELLVRAAEAMESAEDPAPSRAVLDARRRAAHCLRALHEHERARRTLGALLDEEEDPNIRAMIEADLGLLAGEFRWMGSVELPLRKADLDDFLDRLQRGEEEFRRSATAGQSYSAHGNYLLGVLGLGRASKTETDEDRDWRTAEMHLLHARTRFRQLGKAYSAGFVARTDLYFAISRAQRLKAEGLAHAARVFSQALDSGARLPAYLVTPCLEAFSAADEADFGRVVRAMMDTGDGSLLDELARSREALKRSPRLVDRLWERAQSEDRSARERAADLRVSLRGFMAQRRHDQAREVLDRLETLAGEGVGVSGFLGILDNPGRFDPAWSADEALIASARCHEARGDFTGAAQALRSHFFQSLARGAHQSLHDAEGILEWCREHCRPARDAWTDLEDAFRARTAEAVPASAEPSTPVRTVQVLVVGAGEQLARNEDRVRESLAKNHPHIRVRFVLTGWSSKWMPSFREYDRLRNDHDALVLMRFVRTNFGRRVRKAWPGDRPWRFCWGEGTRLLTRTIVGAAAAAGAPGRFSR